jgi:phosphohistidine phosphatase
MDDFLDHPAGMPDRTLILLRHAKSDWSGGEADLLRPLAKRGRRQAPDAGRWLAAGVRQVDLAVVSPAERARSTWQLASAELAAPPPTRFDDRVYAASETELLGLVRELPDEVSTVVLVGHNPGIEDLVSTLTGQWVPMPTSALAVMAMRGPWSTAGHHTAVLTASGRTPTNGTSS